jgi:hypothetical protein
MGDMAEASTEGHTARGRALSLFLVFLFTSLYLLPLVPLGLNPYDEGVRLYGADQVLAGHLPYYDFFAYYGPAQFYWPAILFKVFGTEIVVARLGALVFICVAAVAVFSLCRNAGLSRSWASVPIAALVAPLRTGDQLMTCDPAMSLVLAAGASLTGAWGGRRREFLAGALLGLAASFRPDFGLYGAIAGAAVSLWGCRRGPEKSHDSWPTATGLIGAVWHLRNLLGGIATTAVPVYGFLALHGPRRLVEALLTEPASLMPFRTLPYAYYEVPYLHAWMSGEAATSRALADPGIVAIFVTPLLGLLLSLRLLDRRERQRLPNRNERIATLLFALVTAAGLGIYALGRSDWYHVYPLHVFSTFVASLILGSRVSSKPRLIAIVVALTAVAGVVPGVALRIALVVSGPLRVGIPLSLPRARAIAVNENVAWVGDAVRDISRYGEGGPILVAAQRHDRVHANALILYFLSGRPSGTYFHDMIPGLTTTHGVQQRIVKDLMKNHVRTVVISKALPPDEPNKSRLSSGVFVLDDYLRSEFSRVRQTENYDILVKRE